jgi:hypothetical protein
MRIASKTGASVIEITARQKPRFPVPLPKVMSVESFSIHSLAREWLALRS